MFFTGFVAFLVFVRVFMVDSSGYLGVLNGDTLKVILMVLAVAAGLTSSVAAFRESTARARAEKKIDDVEQLVRENPEKPQLAWELAQTKLESYLNRNLGQVNSIYRLTVMVMFVGFGFVAYGIAKGLETPSNFPFGLLSAISGVVISFIGGSFLLIFRSTTEQAREYVSVLERINAVGMCVQILDSIPNDHAELKYKSRAEVALQLLKIYSFSKEAQSTRNIAKPTKRKPPASAD